MATTTPDDTARAYRAGYRASARIGHPTLDVAEDRYRARYGDALAQHYGQGWVDYSADMPATPPVHGVYASEAMPADSTPALTEAFTDEHGRAALRYLADDDDAGIAAGSEVLVAPTPGSAVVDVVFVQDWSTARSEDDDAPAWGDWDAMAAYLARWDYGDDDILVGWQPGASDDVRTIMVDGLAYTLTVHTGLRYAGLTRAPRTEGV